MKNCGKRDRNEDIIAKKDITTLDGKLDKVTTEGANRAYIATPSGGQTTFDVSDGGGGGNIPRYRANGTLHVDDPSGSTDAVALGFLIEKLKVYLEVQHVLDVLTSTATDKALSANMGRELRVRADAAIGLGGFIAPYDFGTDTPTQQAMTDYAMTAIFGAEASNHDPGEIFNGTKVQNLSDKRVWQLANTPDTTPAVFEWMEALVVSEAQRNFTANPIVTGEITDAAVTAAKLATAIQTLLGYIDISGSLTSLLSGKQSTEAGKGLSTNDFSSTYKTLLDFLSATRTVTSLASIDMTLSATVYANISADQSLSCSGTPPVGQVVHIYLTNAGATDRTVVIPTTGSYVSMSGASVTLPASGYLEINIAYDTNVSKYKIIVLEAK
jgi:hypothetical protein